MNRYLQSVLVAALGVGSVTCAFAQDTTPPPPSSTQESPSTRAPATTADEPSTAAPSRQHQANAGSKASEKQMLNDCIAKEQANNSSVSKSQAKKDCKAQMKANSAEPQSR